MLDKDLEAILTWSNEERYNFFVKTVNQQGKLWGLWVCSGWIIKEDLPGWDIFPVWPLEEFANLCASTVGGGEKPFVIDLNDWRTKCYAFLTRFNYTIAVFPGPTLEAKAVSPLQLKRDLETRIRT